MGIWDKWSEVLDAYRDVNQLLGDIVKVGLLDANVWYDYGICQCQPGREA